MGGANPANVVVPVRMLAVNLATISHSERLACDFGDGDSAMRLVLAFRRGLRVSAARCSMVLLRTGMALRT